MIVSIALNNVTCVNSCTIILQSGSTPLHKAVKSMSSNEQVVEMLIKAGADVNVVNKVNYYQAP